jgi:hypothetical protein
MDMWLKPQKTYFVSMKPWVQAQSHQKKKKSHENTNDLLVFKLQRNTK